MDLKRAIKVVMTNLCEDEKCFFDCDTCCEAQEVLKDYVGEGVKKPKTNFDLCSESVENMANVIDIAKVGWTKEQIIQWLNKATN